MELDFERCYRSVDGRDPRFDGWFFTAVTSTGIYCRPSCPAMTPKRTNVRFFPTAAAAQRGGFRACKRCRPDATPGSPEWNARADLVARAMRLIADGVVDREGVAGLSARLGYTSRHLRRLLAVEVGAGPLALARAQRAQTARTLIETTDLSFARIAFAAGFSSIRQFNDTVREIFATTPGALRGGVTPDGRAGDADAGSVSLRLAHREPFEVQATIAFLAARAVTGVEEVREGVYRRSLALHHGSGDVALAPGPGYVQCRLRLDDLRDLQSAVVRCRALLDLDADPHAVNGILGSDPVMGPPVAARPGLRLVGAVDGAEAAVRIVLGQQVAVAAARTLTGRLVADHGAALTQPDGGISHLFPAPAALASADPQELPLPTTRARAVQALCAALDRKEVSLDVGVDRGQMTQDLLAIPGIGPWTVDLVKLRALGDPDVFLPTDLGVRRALASLGLPDGPRGAAVAAEPWRPWRSYALHHLWALNGRAREQPLMRGPAGEASRPDPALTRETGATR